MADAIEQIDQLIKAAEQELAGVNMQLIWKRGE